MMSIDSDRIYLKLHSSKVFKPFKKYAPGLACRGKCEYSKLTTICRRGKGDTAQELGIRYCKRCAVHWKREAGIRCICCKQLTTARIAGKQSRKYREEQREKENIQAR